jgi:hypothetical protein
MAVAAAVGAAVVAMAARSAAAAAMYNLTHNFNLGLAGNQTYQGVWQWSNHDLATSTTNPPDQHVDNGMVNFAVPSMNMTATPPAVSDGATATVQASYVANANGTGNVNVQGTANCVANGTYALSEGASGVALQRGTTRRDGTMRWSPSWHIVTVRTGRLRDPVDLTFQDLGTQASQSSRLFDLDLKLQGGGTSDMTNGNVTISGVEGTFTLTQVSPYLTAGMGEMVLDFHNGMVTFSQDSGIYNGLLPPVGSSSTNIAFHLGDASGAINLDFNFGAPNTAGYNATAGFTNSGSVDEAGIPEPSGILMLASAGACVMVLPNRQRDRK